MTSALADQSNVMDAISGQCDFFLAKPIRKARLLEELRERNLIN